MRLRPFTVKRGVPFVARVHRRLPRVQGALWAVRVVDGDETVGVALVGHPARKLMDDTLSVLRVAVIDGHPNACSMLYGACSRAAKAMGADNLVTYTHGDEHGTSLKASGWICDGLTDGGEWDRDSRPRQLALDPTAKASMVGTVERTTEGDSAMSDHALRDGLEHFPTIDNAAEMLWVVLANVSGGNWKLQSDEWQEAAARWRDYYFKAVKLRAVPPAPEAAPRWDALNRGLEALMPAQAPPAPPDSSLLAMASQVLETFEASERQGYRSRDRQFAIELLRKAIPAAARPSPREPSDRQWFDVDEAEVTQWIPLPEPVSDLAAQIRALPRYWFGSMVSWLDLAALLPPEDGQP